MMEQGADSPARTYVSIEHDRMSADGAAASYDPVDHTTVLPAYMRLVAMLRNMDPESEVYLRQTEGQVVSAFWAHCMMKQVHERVLASAAG